MIFPLQDYAAAHRYLLDVVKRESGMRDPVAFSPGYFLWYLLRAARKERAVPVDGVLIHDWSPSNRKLYPGLRLGVRLYRLQDVPFASVHFFLDFNTESAG